MYYYNKRFILGFFCTILLFWQAVVEAAPIYQKNGNRLYLDGMVIARRIISKNDSVNGDKTRVRLNLHGETQITPTLYGYGRFERDFNAFEPENVEPSDYTRFAYAGLSQSQWGQLNYGRNDGIFSRSLYTVYMFPVNGGGTYKVDNFIMGKRGNGILTFQHRDLFGAMPGLDVILKYQGKNDGGDRSIQNQNGNGYGVGLAYTVPNTKLEVSSAWGSAEHSDSQRQTYGQKDKASGWIIGSRWQPGNWTLSGFYSETRNMQFINASKGFANKAQTLEAAVRYRFQSGFHSVIGYRQSKAEEIKGVGDAYLLNDFLLLVSYPFNPNLKVSAEHRLNMLKKDNALALASDDVTWLTITFNF